MTLSGVLFLKLNEIMYNQAWKQLCVGVNVCAFVQWSAVAGHSIKNWPSIVRKIESVVSDPGQDKMVAVTSLESFNISLVCSQ